MLRPLTLLLCLVVASCASTPKKSGQTGNPLDKELISQAVRGNLFEMIKAHQAGGNINGKNQVGVTALMVSTYRGHIKVMEYLISNGANVDIIDNQGSSAIHYAVNASQLDNKKRLKAVGLLIKVKANINLSDHFGLTPLMLATRFSKTEVIRFLVDHGADLNSRSQEGWTPIYFSIPRGRPDVFDLLAEKGAGVDVEDEQGETPLHVAALYGEHEIVHKLISVGSRVNLENFSGETPLMLAAKSGAYKSVRLLIQAGAKVNRKSLGGRTALMEAVVSKNKKTIRALLKAGAKANIKDSSGKSSYEIAETVGDAEVIEILKAHKKN